MRGLTGTVCEQAELRPRDVILSPVFDLQQVTDEAVPGAALDKVPLSRQEGLGGRSTVLLQEVVQQRQLALLLHLMEGNGVHHGLNHPAVRRQHKDLIGLYPEGDALLLPDRLQGGDKDFT